MKSNLLKEKSFAFSLRIIKLYKYLVHEKKEHVMAKQILKSGTSIGANIAEAQDAQSNADFIHKYNIALKEARETEYWLRLLKESEFIESTAYESINLDCSELLKLLVSTIKKLKV